jgi:hypothetical protein
MFAVALMLPSLDRASATRIHRSHNDRLDTREIGVSWFWLGQI